MNRKKYSSTRVKFPKNSLKRADPKLKAFVSRAEILIAKRGKFITSMKTISSQITSLEKFAKETKAPGPGIQMMKEKGKRG